MQVSCIIPTMEATINRSYTMCLFNKSTKVCAKVFYGPFFFSQKHKYPPIGSSPAQSGYNYLGKTLLFEF